jgi:hypothetical protein
MSRRAKTKDHHKKQVNKGKDAYQFRKLGPDGLNLLVLLFPVFLQVKLLKRCLKLLVYLFFLFVICSFFFFGRTMTLGEKAKNVKTGVTWLLPLML